MEGKDFDLYFPLYQSAQKDGIEPVKTFLFQYPTEKSKIVNFLITYDLFDIALDILKNHVTLKDYDEKQSGLETLAQKRLAFASGNDFGFFQGLIYKWIPGMNDYSNADSTLPQSGGMEDPLLAGKVVQKVRLSFWNTMKKMVPSINDIQNKKVKNEKAIELVKLILKGMEWDPANAQSILENPIYIATKLGIKEFVKEIIKAYPKSIDFEDGKKRNIFQHAVLHRQEKVFNLIYTMSDRDKHLVTSHKDYRKNNILHLAGESQPSSRISGAALQMQRELRWFKAVKNLVHPYLKEDRNDDSDEDKLTPREVFTKKHKGLVKEGQKWMKNTAQSYTLVAALITTVVFTAVFTIPGGDNSEGVPIYIHKLSFLVFSISDALALFLSSTSVLIFLGILTSTYSEEDFLESLPRKLIIGLITLFLSIVFMMAAFGAALHIVLVHRLEWVAIPIIIPACLTVILFAWSQFPLLVEICRSTYGPSIFKPEKE